MVQSANVLVDNARHKSVTKKRLSQTSGIIFTFLNDDPVISYLNENEQPHYIFAAGGADNEEVISVDREGNWNRTVVDYYSFIALTTDRILAIAGEASGDIVISASLDTINSARFRCQDHPNCWLYFADHGKGYIIKGGFEKSDIEAGKEFLKRKDIPKEHETTYAGLLSSNAKNHTVTPGRLLGTGKYFEPTIDFLETGEEPHYLFPLTTGSAALAVESGASREELLDSGGSAVVTDRAIRIIGSTGDWSIPYNSITSVDMVASPSLHVQTHGRTYYLNVAKYIFDLESEVSDAAQFIRSKQRDITARNSSSSTIVNGELDPKEKLEQLNDLYDQDILTKEEFKQKKNEILDQL